MKTPHDSQTRAEIENPTSAVNKKWVFVSHALTIRSSQLPLTARGRTRCVALRWPHDPPSHSASPSARISSRLYAIAPHTHALARSHTATALPRHSLIRGTHVGVGVRSPPPQLLERPVVHFLILKKFFFTDCHYTKKMVKKNRFRVNVNFEKQVTKKPKVLYTTSIESTN